ncbi:hypothetical protein [Methylobacterium sp. J-070]|uniref:hypothetical protein n=1 Tax=Methylobacterium sp. J-070 TaxID=2836650 RepID=UPI001FB9B6D0|nr:hypothetical protein [Methylobacterium sp. J-070]MCJ2051665.1 hypothetical protein [Methylobacterium sp. J-070]
MDIGRITGTTRTLGAPQGWDQTSDGPCVGLPIRDERHTRDIGRMISAWVPTEADIALIQAGAPIYLHVIGEIHPPVSLVVGNPPVTDVQKAEVRRG